MPLPTQAKAFATSIEVDAGHLRGLLQDAGFEVPEPSRDHDVHQSLSTLVAGLPTTLLISSSGEADLLA